MSLSLHGYKSFDTEGQKLTFGPVTVLLGANGAGKSNVVSFFRLLNFMTTESLQTFVANQGFAESLLHFGAKITSEIHADLCFTDGLSEDVYSLILSLGDSDRLFVRDETISYHAPGYARPQLLKLGGGGRESQLPEKAKSGNSTARVALALVSNCRVFQFHDTSPTAKIRLEGYVDDNRYLRSDAGNLAAFLYAMREEGDSRKYYERIVSHIRIIMPQFGDFDLSPSKGNEKYLRLNWRERDSDYLFGPHQLSDGALRFMALTSLFLQPTETLPRLIVVDEPELGLHPAAIASLAGMIKATARNCQIVLATQSPLFVNEFTPEDIAVIEREKDRSVIRRLDQEKLQEWVERYSLAELWEKNVLGGRP